MIQPRQILNFMPPKLDGEVKNEKRRYMIIATNEDNTIEMINVSSVRGKEHKMFLPGVYRFKDFKPFKIPSFAKTDTIYKIEYFEDLDNFVCFEGNKLNKEDFNNMLETRKKYIDKTKNIKEIIFTKENFMNKNLINV